jgi:hypothetical protein
VRLLLLVVVVPAVSGVGTKRVRSSASAPKPDFLWRISRKKSCMILLHQARGSINIHVLRHAVSVVTGREAKVASCSRPERLQHTSMVVNYLLRMLLLRVVALLLQDMLVVEPSLAALPPKAHNRLSS